MTIWKIGLAVMLPATALAAASPEVVSSVVGAPAELTGVSAVGTLALVCWRLIALAEKAIEKGPKER